jgi:hemoglobin
MRRWLFVCLVLACLPCTAPAADQLFQDLGGKEGIERISSLALDLYFTDPRLADSFDNINRAFLQPRFTAFICRTAGGPCVYKGHSMRRAHKGLVITQANFNAVVEDLEKAMDRAGVPFRTQNRLLARLAPMERDIVTR